MNIAQILQNLFEVYPSPTCTRSYNDLSYEEHIQEFTSWLKQKLIGIQQECGSAKVLPEGRLGPSKVVFVSDQNDSNNLVKISKDKLTIQSQSAFCTLKANCCVYKGKWMYEVQLRSKGVMQIGWCSSKCTFTQDTGVGDTKHSYGFDGSKQRIWHVHTRKYGPYWRSGDVFGVCLDMDDGKIEYYRNGVSLGVAFDGKDVSRGPGIALFPAFSLAFDDSLTANFGGSPFRHPIDGYHPLQMQPTAKLEKADFLLNHLVNIARVISTNRPQKQLRSNKEVSADTTYALLASLLINEISPILCNSYVIEEKVFKHVKGMCVIRTNIDSNSVIYPGLTESTLGTFLSLFWTYLPGDNMKCFLSKFAAFLSSMYRETPVDLNYEKQRIVIVVLTCICNHPATRKYLLEHKFFSKNLLPIFLYIKPPDESTLADLIPDQNVWTIGMDTSKEAYLNDCQKLNASTDALYTLQKNLMEKLLINNDGNESSPSSRKIFITKLRKYVIENSVEHRTIFFLEGITYAPPTQPAVALSFLCILLDVIQSLYANELSECAAFVPPCTFYDGSLQYFHFDRVGGVLTHLQRHYRQELQARLGSDGESTENNDEQIAGIYNGVELSDIYSAMFLLTGSSRSSLNNLQPDVRSADLLANLNSGLNVGNGSSSNFTKINEAPVKPGDVSAHDSLKSLLDCCILYYYAVAHKYIIMIADLRDSIGTLSDILCETKLTYEVLLQTMETVSSDTMISSIHADVLKDLHDKLMERRQVFLKRSTELARKQAWYRSVALGKFRRNLLCWMLNAVVRTLKEASEEGDLFVFVPEFYINILPILLETVMDFSFHDLNVQNDLADCSQIIMSAAEFLCSKAANSRIVLASCRDALLQALGTLTCHEAGIRALERCSLAHQKTLISSLMRPYQGRAWGQSNWLLLRFWLGDGFAYRDARQPSIWQDGTRTPSLGLFRSRGKNGTHTGLLHHIAPCTPSAHFQNIIAEMLIEDEPFSTTLINSILSQLNWAFSEFVLLLQELQNGFQRQDNSHSHSAYESRQSKICAMCFELTVSLMRTLEMMISIAPSLFIDADRPNSITLLNRVCQLISQVMSRVTVPPGGFQCVIDMCLPELSGVTHFAIISAAIGILLALLKNDIDDDEGFINMPKVAKILLTDPSFHIACLEYTVGEVKTPIQIQQEIPRGNFDAHSRGHIDPLTNEVRFSSSRPRCEQPVIKFSLIDYPTHVTADEIEKVRKLIKFLLTRKSLLSDVTLPSDDTICTICYATSISATFQPCNHQSCSSCIIQHLMNTKVCFYCKTPITKVHNFDGTTIYEPTAQSSASQS